MFLKKTSISGLSYPVECNGASLLNFAFVFSEILNYSVPTITLLNVYKVKILFHYFYRHTLSGDLNLLFALRGEK